MHPRSEQSLSPDDELAVRYASSIVVSVKLAEARQSVIAAAAASLRQHHGPCLDGSPTLAVTWGSIQPRRGVPAARDLRGGEPASPVFIGEIMCVFAALLARGSGASPLLCLGCASVSVSVSIYISLHVAVSASVVRFCGCACSAVRQLQSALVRGEVLSESPNSTIWLRRGLRVPRGVGRRRLLPG
jgi:hypothetical protein